MRKWKCVSVNNGNEEYFTVGKFYETDNNGYGVIVDSGTKIKYVSLLDEMKCHNGELQFVEVKDFTKSDLKPFMLVKLRDGDLCIVSQSKLGVSFNSEFGFMSFYSYNDELLCFDDGEREEYYDVMEVYDISNKYYDANKLSTDNRELLFKREEQSLRDIKIKELQDKMDAIKREMEELK